jgi:hypothetical protein
MQTTVGNAWEIPQTPPGRVAEVATAELEAELVLLGTLEGQDWRRPTDCAGWDVHDLTAHLACEYDGCPGRCAACRWPGCFPKRRGGCPTPGLATCWT